MCWTVSLTIFFSENVEMFVFFTVRSYMYILSKNYGLMNGVEWSRIEWICFVGDKSSEHSFILTKIWYRIH